MKKIPTLFQRNHEGNKLVRDDVTPECFWVIQGQGVATRKWDGTCCMVRDGRLYKRRECRGWVDRDGFRFDCPPFFEECERDIVTGKVFGWTPVMADNPEDRWHIEAYTETLPNGTYELLGPKVNGNPEGLKRHVLVPHGDHELALLTDRSFDGIRAFLGKYDMEGIVFHHSDGRMAKIKGRDFGIRRRSIER